MPCRNIICDWNGTLFEHATDEVQNKAIAFAALDDAKAAILKGRIWRIADLLGLVKTKKLLNRRLEEYNDGKRHLWEVYEPFNRGVLEGMPVSRIERVVGEYATASASLVDGRMLKPINEAKRSGVRTGILSVSYDYSILKILEVSGYAEVFEPTDVVANTLQQRGDTAVGFTLNIYEKKRQVFEEVFLKDKGLSPEDTFYSGDRLDDDGPVASLLPRGHFIVPFLAGDDTKQAFAKDHDAFVPESEEDLRRFLASQ